MPIVDLTIDKSLSDSIGEEGYLLNVTATNVFVRSATKTGIFYGIQTIRQLIQRGESKGEYILPCVEIMDRPRFKWRGFMLDVSRHFFGVNTIKVILDEMALLKMNIFHWHLTDDQGWRIPIVKYPRLISVASKRDSSMVNREKNADGGWNYEYDGTPHQGFYSYQEIAEIVRYASDRNITIVPEIDMPSHNQAAMAAYPWLSTTKKKISVPTVFFGAPYKINPAEINVAKPKVVKFFKDVLDETMELFPSNIIHAGGDEVWFNLWKESDEITNFMETNHLKTYPDLQMWFTNLISKHISSKGKRMMVWNDAMGGHLENDAESEDYRITIDERPDLQTIVGFWRGDTNLINETVKKGYDIVNGQSSFSYFNDSYKSLPLEKVYSFNPIPLNLEEVYSPKILGVSCHLWTEWVPDESTLYFQLFPRIAAFAEVGWTEDQNKNISRFKNNLFGLKKHWDKVGITYHDN